MRRQIVIIDEEKCNGCGECVPSCAEGALQIIDGKARLVSERYCDGLGACLGSCPQDAIRLEERECEPFDEEAVAHYLSGTGAPVHACPSLTVPVQDHRHRAPACPGLAPAAETDSGTVLNQWPIQLALVPVRAAYLEGAHLLVAADCAAFAGPGAYQAELAGKALVVGCPKLDDSAHYAAKLRQILRSNAVRSVTVLHMEVPCCFGLTRLVRTAAQGLDLPVREVTMRIDGSVVRD